MCTNCIAFFTRENGSKNHVVGVVAAVVGTRLSFLRYIVQEAPVERKCCLDLATTS